MSLSIIASAGSLHQAVRARDLITLKSLLNPASDIDLDETIGDGVTALHLAAATDFAPAIKLLIERGASVNPKTTAGFTPLHWAASRNATDAVSMLIENGANINVKAQNGITPLHWAAHKDAADAVKLLIAAGADISAKTSLGYTPLHFAVEKNPYSKSAVLLAKAKVDAEVESGFLVLEDLPEEKPEKENIDDTTSKTNTLTENLKQPRALPGTFLEVPLGLGSSLEFVWIKTLKIWFGKYEITNRQYRHYDHKHNSRMTEGLDLNLAYQPVVYVSWNDASNYCNWLNTTYSNRIPVNCEFRLPTSKEWNFVAACGGSRRYPWGNEWPPVYGNYSDETARRNLSQWRGILGYDDGYTVTCPVKNSGMNEWGIYGLAGNVWEWCDDWMNNADRVFKIRKGGSWDFDTKDSLKIMARGVDRPTARYDTIGFRVIVAPKEKSNILE